MSCRVGMSTNPQERIRYWQKKRDSNTTRYWQANLHMTRHRSAKPLRVLYATVAMAKAVRESKVKYGRYTSRGDENRSVLRSIGLLLGVFSRNSVSSSPLKDPTSPFLRSSILESYQMRTRLKESAKMLAIGSGNRQANYLSVHVRKVVGEFRWFGDYDVSTRMHRTFSDGIDRCGNSRLCTIFTAKTRGRSSHLHKDMRRYSPRQPVTTIFT